MNLIYSKNGFGTARFDFELIIVQQSYITTFKYGLNNLPKIVDSAPNHLNCKNKD